MAKFTQCYSTPQIVQIERMSLCIKNIKVHVIHAEKGDKKEMCPCELQCLPVTPKSVTFIGLF